MPNLKELKNRISSVKSTQKITSAMKMVAASKLRRAQEQAEAGRPYAERIARMLRAVRQSFMQTEDNEAAPPLIRGHLRGGKVALWDDPEDVIDKDFGRFDKFDPLPSLREMKEEDRQSSYYIIADEPSAGKDGESGRGDREEWVETHLFLVCTSDRGLCGGFNSSIIREVRRRVRTLETEGKKVLLMFAGRKGRDVLQREYPSLVVGHFDELGKERTLYADAQIITDRIIKLFEDETFDICTVVFNRFKSVISQVPTAEQLVPMGMPEEGEDAEESAFDGGGPIGFEFEPEESILLKELLPYALSVQVYHALLESTASEHGARMTAMDNATRNAGEMIDKLTLTYNRTRQAYITKELIEIISGAEAL